MKSKSLALSILLFSFIGILSTGCSSMISQPVAPTSSKHSVSLTEGQFDNAHIPPYVEYEPISIVFAATYEESDIKSPYLTYMELLKKAQELGGHAIINVVIEENANCTKTKVSQGIYDEGDTACIKARFGSALAIRYIKPIMEISTFDQPKVTQPVEPSNKDDDSKSFNLF